jgi:hypothetical protein
MVARLWGLRFWSVYGLEQSCMIEENVEEIGRNDLKVTKLGCRLQLQPHQ